LPVGFWSWLPTVMPYGMPWEQPGGGRVLEEVDRMVGVHPLLVGRRRVHAVTELRDVRDVERLRAPVGDDPLRLRIEGRGVAPFTLGLET
jgi:hypothetical protein